MGAVEHLEDDLVTVAFLAVIAVIVYVCWKLHKFDPSSIWRNFIAWLMAAMKLLDFDSWKSLGAPNLPVGVRSENDNGHDLGVTGKDYDVLTGGTGGVEEDIDQFDSDHPIINPLS
jgi:hypothetical protein